MKLTINQRIVLGFVILIAVYGISGYISLRNLDESKDLTTRNSTIIQPSIILLHQLELMVVVSKEYSRTWLTMDISDHEDKIKLKQIHKTDYPELKDKLRNMAENWNDPKDKRLLDTTLACFTDVMNNQKMLMNSLNNIDAYQDFLLRVEIEENQDVQINSGTEKTVNLVKRLLKSFNQKSEAEEEQVLESFSSIRTSNILLSILAVFIGLIVALATLRSVRLEEQKNKVTEERDLIQTQKKIIEEKNQEITDSINYAQRIQRSILPSDKTIAQYLNDYFIYYRPRDIVSGDFYWFRELGNNEILIAAADSTGHGVPGAFVSLVCYSSLNRSVNEFGIQQPGKILDKTTELVQTTFAQYGEGNVQDGMDIALCKLNLETLAMEYSGAHNSAYIVRDGELHELKATRQSVGGQFDKQDFENHTFQLQKGDSLYIFSDGYQDQFGGQRNKKYKTKNFLSLLTRIAPEPAAEQQKKLEEEFQNWKGDEPQLDDILVIGIKI